MNGVLETGAQQTDDLVVDMVSDLICPWCFVGKRRVEKAAAILNKKVEVHWLPFELNADMPVDGLDRRVYRSAKFGSWEESQRLDAQVAAAGAEVGIAFRHDRMKRTPNTFRGHVLLAAALKDSVEMQGKVAERLFQAYFVNGEDVGDPAVLLGIAREFGVSAISGVQDLDSPELVAEVRATERRVSAGVRGVPQISFGGRVLASGAQHEELLAASIREIQGTSGQCENGVCTV
ncbi:MAG TPA: DsbA family oxidoreductase [Candidatus Sulfotelmatobacter sp.]